MNRLTLMSAAGIVALTAGMAVGGQVDYHGKVWGSPGGGGPFEFEPVAGTGLDNIQGLGLHGAAAGRFITFCLEYNENLPITRYDATVDTASVRGGLGGGSPDPLDFATAYLYTQFMNGTLTTGGFTYLDPTSGFQLQLAIWALEDEISPVQLSGMALALYNKATDERDLLNGGTWGNTLGNVRVLNLFDTRPNGPLGEPRQSQLVMIPLPGVAGMATVGLAGLMGVGFVRRRR